jgi:hypothetical protein
MTIDLQGPQIFWSESCICKHRGSTNEQHREDHGENEFAKRQRSRDLRASSDAAELETQLVERER